MGSVHPFPTERKHAQANPRIKHTEPPEGIVSIVPTLNARRRAAYDEAYAKRPEATPELILFLAMADALEEAGLDVKGKSFLSSMMCRMSTKPLTQQPDHILRAGNLVSELVMAKHYPAAH